MDCLGLSRLDCLPNGATHFAAVIPVSPIFGESILRISDGDAGDVNDGDATIGIPDDLLIRNSADSFLDLIQFVYPDLRRKFPLMVSFAMTINKSQGQTLSQVGLYMSRPVFSHGQLYVALSRVKSRSGIKILTNSESGETTNMTNNIVYKEVFQRI
ncbi:PREDICTED: uncharacterized protein LOC105956152 [Erythranthe guttata]|uniref:uncharacterized protein LOC105956152 n=1 Tax=Erythranthe guttata TaxID=4155 RepID=UPI00064DCFE9|nr:PREDICTED: uncharacterized protein LOC105956152 [Erythranthe guttata]|eukprot:XP_012835446.1 PREDICTED: uncharacterized protein LOC105956152 [Erythranthe guttata]